MKLIVIAILLSAGIAQAQDHDSLAREIASVINAERQRIGLDTLVYEADTFRFATDWADSTNRYFNVEGNPFSRKAAHRDCPERVVKYEKARGREWKHFGECVGNSSINKMNLFRSARNFAVRMLDSKDHYDMLMEHQFKRIIIGVSKSDGHFSSVVFVTAEF